MDNNSQKHPLSPKKIALFVLYALIAVFLLLTVLSFNDLPGIIEQLKTVDTGYVLLGVLMVIIYLALFPVSLCLLAKANKINASMPMIYTIGMIEHFFNGITPLATGGQPFQAHAFTKAKVKLGESTGLLMTNLLLFMIATNGLSVAALLCFDSLTSSIDSFWYPIIIIGYTLNLLLLAITFTLAISRKVRNGLLRFIHFISRRRPFKKLQNHENYLRVYFEQVQQSVLHLIHNKKYFFVALFTKVLSYCCLYGSAYFILLSMGVPVTPAHIPLIILGTSFAITAVGFIPTPGASGGVEGAAGQIYNSIILLVSGGALAATSETMANSVMLIWRLLSYYFVMLVSLLFYIGLEIYFNRKKAKEEAPESASAESVTDKSDTTD